MKYVLKGNKPWSNLTIHIYCKYVIDRVTKEYRKHETITRIYYHKEYM